MTDPIRVGAMRWPIKIFKRYDVPDPASANMLEALELIAEVSADVQPTGPVTYYGSITADFEKPVSHRIFTRWFSPYDPSYDLNYQITRTLHTPDNRVRTELFRVWRHMEMEGKQRFIQFDCQIETITSGGSQTFKARP